MANNFTIGPKLAIDGEREFKDAIAGINKNMTVLGSEMKKVTAQFSDNAGSMEALTAKQDVYSRQLDEQKNKVKALKDALANAAQEYGENSDKVKEWQIKLNNAEAALAKTESSLKQTNNQIDNFGKEADTAGKETKQLGKELDGAGKHALNFGDILKANLLSDAIAGGVRMLGNAISAAFGQFKQMASDAMYAADEMTALSDETGFSTEKLQEMKYIGDDLGVSLETQTGALSKMINNMSSAKSGTGAAADAFAALGISVTDANGELRDSNEMYGEVLDALSGVTNETERTAIAQDIFGRSAMDLNPLIKAGSEGLADLAKQAKDSGAIMSGDTVKSLDSLGDTMDHLKQSASTAAGTLLSQFAPGLEEVANSLSGLMNGTVTPDQFAETITSLIGQITTTLTDMLPAIITAGGDILTTLIDGIVAALPNLIPAAVDLVLNLVTALIENLPLILDAGIQVVIALVQGIAQSLPTLIPTIVDAVMTMVETLIDNIDLIIDAGIDLLIGLATGLIDAIPMLVEKIPTIITKLVTALTNPDTMVKLVDAALKITVGLVGGLIQAIPELLKAVPQMLGALTGAFSGSPKELLEAGRNVVSGLWNGIKERIEWLKGKVSGFLNDIVKGVKDVLGIRSPSKVFEGIGGYLSEGLAKGITGKSGLVSAAMSGINKNLQAEANISVSGSSGGGIGYATSNLYMDGVIVASSTSKAQYRRNQGAARAFGVVPV
jgi:phage-related protein